MTTKTEERPELAAIRTDGQEYLRLYAKIMALEEEKKVLQAKADEVEVRMVEGLQGIDQRVCHLDGVGRFQLDPQVYVQVNKDDKPQVIEWLKSDPDGKEIVGEDVNAARLKSFVKERLTQGKPLHELVKVTNVTQIKFVGAKA